MRIKWRGIFSRRFDGGYEGQAAEGRLPPLSAVVCLEPKGVYILLAQSVVRKHLQRYLQITLGCLVTCLGFNLFLIPAHLLTGGLSGLALIVYNLPIIYLAYRVFGRLYAWDTIVGTVVLSVILDATHFMVAWQVAEDPMLCAIFGGVLAGIGFGLVFRANANTGGLDVVAAVVKKYYALDVGTVVFVLNFIIVMSSAFMFTLQEALFTLVAIYVTAELTNRVTAGLNREKSVMVISPQAQIISRELMQEIGHGTTFLDGRGGFAGERKDILFMVVRLTQVSRVKTIVNHFDPQAFMIVSDTSEVRGKGFTLACESYESARAKWEEEQAQAQERQKNTPQQR